MKHMFFLRERGGGSTYLLVGREDGKTSTSGLMLLWSAECPKGNGPATKLGEPALEFGLCRVMREA